MKKSELTKLRSKKTDELEKIVAERKLKLLKMHANLKAGKEKNLKKAKNLKRDIAQLLTLIGQMRLAQESATAAEEKKRVSKKINKNENK